MNFNSKSQKFLFYYFPAALFSLLPFFLITGPFLSDLSISIISIIYLVYCYNKRNFDYFKNKFFYFFLVFWIYLIINSLLINSNIDSLKISIFFIRYGIFVIAITNLLEFNDIFKKYFFYCIILCFIILTIDGYYQYFNGKNIIGYLSPQKFRVSSFFHEEMILGSYLSRLWPLLFGLSIYIFKNQKFNLLILIFILSEVLIFLSGERSAFFYINLSAIFVIIFSQKLLKLRLIILSSSVLIIVLISLYNPTAKERVFDQTISQMNLDQNFFLDKKSKKLSKNIKEDLYIFSKQHTQHYLTAFSMFDDHKFFGVGVKNFRNFCSDKKYSHGRHSCSTHPHNIYVQILTETGMIGFFFLLFTLFYFCKEIILHLINKLKGKCHFNDFEICILSGLLIFLWPVIPTGNVFNNWISIITILNIPFLLWERSKKR